MDCEYCWRLHNRFSGLEKSYRGYFWGYTQLWTTCKNQDIGKKDIQSLLIHLTNGCKYSHRCLGWIVYAVGDYIPHFCGLEKSYRGYFWGSTQLWTKCTNQFVGEANNQPLLIHLPNGDQYSHLYVGCIVNAVADDILAFLA